MFGSKTIVISLIVICLMVISLIIGVYISWNNFTPPENSSNDNPPIGSEEHPDNLIIAGNANVAFDFLDNDSYKPVGRDTALFGEDKTWTPGQAKVVYLRITNNGESEINYALGLNIVDEKGSVNKADQEFKLSDYLQFGFAEDYDPSGDTNIIDALSATDGVKSGVSRVGVLTAEDNVVTLALVVYLPESAAEAVDIFEGRAVPEIALGVTLMVSQPMNGGNSGVATKPDSFTASAPVADAVTDGVLSNPVTIGGGQSMSATLPEGVKLEDGATEVTLSVNNVESSEAHITLGETEAQLSLDVHIAGIAADNITPMEIVLSGVAAKGLNSTNIKLYHVENGETIEMTQVALADEFSEHNQFKYDPAMGDIALNIASFSEIAVVSDTVNPWDGKSANSFNKGSGTEADPYLIANASELAFFRDVVDGKVSWDGDATFKGQYVALACDIILNHQGETSNQFDPIGWGYDNPAYNRDNAQGKVFMGTFDGKGHGIHGLLQNGWDLEDPNNDGVQDADYTYTNCGFGLFASIKDATIKNLEIKHANVVVECVEAGIVVGLAQGNCTFQNLMVYSSQIANYQRPAGGVVGEVSPSFEDGVAQACTVLFDNVRVGSSCTVGSLWGDFDTPCGGVIGAYWDDSGNTKVHMKDVDVSCVLDVYSDVTSAYQWYAYRRAGMLIGNTDQPPADGKNSKIATAGFLTCENCVVIYDYWVDYKYCQFTNDQNPGKNYPWVRIQASQYNGAYSNPRYGNPKDNEGVTVTSDNHQHKAGDACHEHIPFNQLYGGGQGVYGQPAHDGVTIGKYVVVYMEGDEIYDVKYVVSNDQPFDDFLELEAGYDWVDMDGVHYTKNGENKIPAGNIKDYVLYKNTINTRMIRFVDSRGFVISEQLLPQIDKNNADEAYYKSFYESKLTIPDVPHIDGYVGVWPEWWKIIKDTPADQDVAIHAVYTIIYEGDTETDDEGEIVILDETNDMSDLFELLSIGKSVVMYKDLAGSIGNASKVTFGTVTDRTKDGWVSNHARLDLDSYEFVYTNDSNANKDWTLFTIKEGSSLTIGGGVSGSGTLSFVFDALNGNASPTLFHLEHDASTDEVSTLIIERGVTIEMKFKDGLIDDANLQNENIETLITGHAHADGTEEQYHPGIDVQIVKETINGDEYDVIRIVCNSYTTFVGNT